MRSCLIPERGGHHNGRALFLLGDSHAAAISHGLKRAVEGFYTVVGVWRSACGYTSDVHMQDTKWGGGRPSQHLDVSSPNRIDDPLYRQAYFNCRFDAYIVAVQYRDAISNVLQEHLRSGDIVAVTGMHGFPVSLLEFYRDFLHPLVVSRGAKLVLIQDFPTIPALPAMCTPTRFNPGAEATCERPYDGVVQTQGYDGEKVDLPIGALAEEFVSSRPDAFYFNQTQGLMCTSTSETGVCGYVVPGTHVPAYVDQAHLNLVGSLYLWPFFCAAFRQWGLFD